MRSITVSVVWLVLASSVAFGDGPAINLGRAASRGKIVVRARAESGHSRIRVAIQNRGAEAISVDVFGSTFLSPRGSYQRLGVPRYSIDSGDTVLTIAPGSTWTGVMPCVCLDGSRSSPGHGLGYRLSVRLVTTIRQRIFRVWNRHPKMSQGEIQNAIWGRRMPAAPPPPPIARPSKPDVVVAGGLTYILDAKGRVRIEDLASCEVSKPIKAGKDFCSLIAGGNTVFAIRQTTRRGTEVFRRLDDGWRKENSIRAPVRDAAALSSRGAVFATSNGPVVSGEAWLPQRETGIVSLSVGSFRGRQLIAALLSNGDGLMIDPGRKTFRKVARRCTFIGVGNDLTACTYGKKVFWQRPGMSGTETSTHNIDRTLLARNHLVVVSSGKAYWLTRAGEWVSRELPSEFVDYDLDGSDGSMHFLMKNGRVQKLEAPTE